MSVDLTVYLARAKMPTPVRWAKAIELAVTATKKAATVDIHLILISKLHCGMLRANCGGSTAQEMLHFPAHSVILENYRLTHWLG